MISTHTTPLKFFSRVFISLSSTLHSFSRSSDPTLHHYYPYFLSIMYPYLTPSLSDAGFFRLLRLRTLPSLVPSPREPTSSEAFWQTSFLYSPGGHFNSTARYSEIVCTRSDKLGCNFSLAKSGIRKRKTEVRNVVVQHFESLNIQQMSV